MPDRSFPILEPQDQEIGEFHAVQERLKFQNCERVGRVGDSIGTVLPDEPFHNFGAKLYFARCFWII